MGRHAFVTGANRGIGLAITSRLARAGFSVSAATRSGTMPHGLDGVVTPVTCDVVDPASVDAAFDTAEATYGPVEVLVANAGITRDHLLMRMSEDDFSAVVDTNLTGAWRCVKRASRSMTRQRWGRVILIGSVTGMYGLPGQSNYAASKAALVGLARSAAREIGSRGITVNVVAPGFIDSDMTAELDGPRRDLYLTAIPLGRFGAADEVAAVVEFLAGDDAGYVTGALLPVDGGAGMGH